MSEHGVLARRQERPSLDVPPGAPGRLPGDPPRGEREMSGAAAGGRPLRTIGLFAFVLSRAALIATARPSADTLHYARVAQRWWEGAAPYRDVAFEYPPGALALVGPPGLLADFVGSYPIAFAAWTVLLEAMVLGIGLRLLPRRDGTRLVLALTVLPLFLGSLVVSRLDGAVGALLALGLLLSRARRGTSAAAVVGLAASMKLLPLLAAPAVIFAAKSPRERWRRVLALLVGLGGPLGLGVAVFGRDAVASWIGYHAERGIEVSSLWAAVVRFIDEEASTAFHHGAHHVQSALAGHAATAALLTVVAGLLALGGARPRQAWLPGRSARLAIAALALAIALAPVGSPQYLLLLAPLFGVVRPRRLTLILFALTLVVTRPLYPALFAPLVEGHAAPLALVLVRTGLLLALVVDLAGLRLRPARRAARALTRAATSAHPALLPLVTAGVFLWLGLDTLYPVQTQDLWFHLRVGEETIGTGKVPDVDTWSATARGEPFTAHSWGSAVFLYALYTLDDGRWLPLLRAVTMLLTLLALYAALPRRPRGDALLLPLLLGAAVYLAAVGVVRPLAVSTVMFAVHVLLLERWRSTRAHALVLVAPAVLAVIWVRAHGGFLAGPGLLALGGVGALLEARLGGRGARTGPRLTLVDAGVLFAGAALAAAAALFNPYGARAFTHALGMVEDRAALGSFVSEWAPGWAPVHQNGAWWFLLAGAAASVAVALWLARRRRPLFDVVIALALGVALAGSIRFAKLFLLAVTPILARRGGALARLATRAPDRRALLVPTAGLLLALFAVTAVVGHQPRFDRRGDLGLGVARPQASRPISALVAAGASGVVLTEYVDSGYLLWAGRRTLRPVFDTRIDIYPAALRDRYFAVLEKRASLLPFLEEHDVDYVVLTQRASTLGPVLDEDPGWTRMYSVEEGAVYERARKGR